MKLLLQLRKRLHIWWPPAVVLAVGIALSAGLWQALSMQQAQTVQERLEQQAHLLTASIEQRMHAYSDLVQGLRLLVKSAALSKQEAFSVVELTQDAAHRYPGAETLTYVLHMDPQEYAVYKDRLLSQTPASQRIDEALMTSVDDVGEQVHIIDEVWPAEARHLLKGLDIRRFEAVEALLKSLPHTDQPLMSRPFSLKDTAHGKTGVVISLPLKQAEGARSPEDMPGFLNLSVNLERLMLHFIARGMLSHSAVEIRDIGADGKEWVMATQDNLLYVSDEWESFAGSALRVRREIAFGGRIWSFEFVPNASVLSQVEQMFPQLVSLGSLGATALLALLVGLLSYKRSRAQLQVAAKHHLLRQRTQRFNALFHQSAIGVAEVAPASGRYISANTRFIDVVGFGLDALESMDIYELIHPDDRAECCRLMHCLTQGKVSHFTITQRLVRGDGGVIWCEAWVAPLQSSDGKPSERLIMLLQDVSERRLMQEQLQAREAYSSEMLRYMPVGLVVVGSLGEIEFVNHQFEITTGWLRSDLTDESAMWRLLCANVQQHNELLKRLNAGRCEVVPTGVNMPAMEYLLRSKCGRELSMEVSGRFLGGRILLSFVDVSQRKAAEAEIRWLGFYDTLTQLPNRRLLLDRLGEALVHSQRANSGKGALLLLDLDNFKSLNETLGHELGDALLRLVATRLGHCVSGRHTLARQGGDEFAVVLEDLPADPLEAGRCTEQAGGAILQALRAPFYLGGSDYYVTVSMGAVVFSDPEDTVEELLKRADLALYQAKSAGRDTLQFFDPSMQKAVSARVQMEKDLRQALDRHEFDLFYQPQVQGNQVVGAEALLRWSHPVKGFIPPCVFVPAAEESGLILPLGEWVLFAACRQLAHWALDPVLAQLTMAVNVSPRQFYQPDFVTQVQQALLVTGANPQRLELELTEGMLLTDIDDTIAKMVQLKAMGVIFSLDDFGTGYSSLSYLKRLPLDKLKIDQSFIREVVSNSNDAAITRSIIALGHSLGLKVIAEGVENQAQQDFLESNGCNYWQGFHFSCPQQQAPFEAWVRTYSHQASDQALELSKAVF